jgi:hypothetical protein
MSSIIAVLIGAATFLDQTLLLIVLLTLLTPLRRLIFSILFFLVTLFLSFVNSSTVMLRWAVDRHKLQRLSLRCVDELVLSAGWDDDDVGSLDVLLQYIVNADRSYPHGQR